MGYKLTGVKGWHGKYQRGDEAVEINYEGMVRITGKHSCPGVYRIEGIGWDLPKWDDSAWESDLIPVKVQATTIGGDNREVW